MGLRIDVLTLFPNLIHPYFEGNILERAVEQGVITIHTHNIRDYSTERHKKVDDTPYGGGAGMVMTPQPLHDCITAVKKMNPKAPVIYMAPQGRMFNHKLAKKLTKLPGMILLCGRYEGIDQRIRDTLIDMEICIGKYVVTGGELPALIVIDAVTRLLPGALGNEASPEEESFSEALNGKKEYPHYTKPAIFNGMEVPEVLRSGNHAKINAWRKVRVK